MKERLQDWWIVAAAALGAGLGAGVLIVYTFGVFVTPISTRFGWERSILAACVTMFMFSNGIGTIWLGNLISRYGLRRPTISFMVLFAMSVAAVAILPPVPWLFLLNFCIMGIFGAAATVMPYSVGICAYFDKNRGLVLGIAMLGSGLGSTLAPQLAAFLLEALGWRGAIGALAAIVASPILGIALTLRTPPGTVRVATDKGTNRYLRDRNFYLIVAAVVGNSVAAIGVMTSIVPMNLDRGGSLADAAAMMSVAGAASFVGRLLVGWLLDRIFAPWVAATLFVLAAGGTLLIVYGGSSPLAFVGAGLVGTCLGAEADLVAFLVSRYFPKEEFSRALGGVWLAWAWGGGIGTLVAGQSYDLTGTYNVSLWLFGMMLIASAVVLLLLPQYVFGHDYGSQRAEADAPVMAH